MKLDQASLVTELYSIRGDVHRKKVLNVLRSFEWDKQVSISSGMQSVIAIFTDTR